MARLDGDLEVDERAQESRTGIGYDEKERPYRLCRSTGDKDWNLEQKLEV